MSRDELACRIENERPRIEAILRDRARGLLRFETLEDLVQGAILEMLGSPPPDPATFEGWVATVVRGHIATRHRYWRACRRDGGHLLRITQSAAMSSAGGVSPAGRHTGPATRAEIEDGLDAAARAASALPERDRELVGHLRAGLSIEETAVRLGLSYGAAQRARLRAEQRFLQALGMLR